MATCLEPGCVQLSGDGPRCKRHTKAKRKRNAHYGGNFAKRRAQLVKTVRKFGGSCWLCGHTFGPDDVVTADHYVPGDTSPDARLLPACKSCNTSRGRRTDINTWRDEQERRP